MSDWQPIKTEDLVRLYREGWTLKLNDRSWTINKHKNSKQVFKVEWFNHDDWKGKPPEKEWVKRYDRESFLVAMAWLENGGISFIGRRIRRAGGRERGSMHADADGSPVYCDTSIIPSFSVADVSAEDWELWQEEEVAE